MPITASLIAAISPMLVYLLLIWRMDKYEPEPIKFVLLHFLWGAFGAIILGVIGTYSLNIINNVIRHQISSEISQTILFAPISEEIAKGAFIIFSSTSKKFDNATDGIVYGAAIGLGFGMTENFLYYISYGDTYSSWVYLVIIRSLFSAVMHGISTGIFGAILGLIKYKSWVLRLPIIFVGMLIAVSIHALWNFSVSFESTYLYGFLSMILLIIIFIQMLKYSVNNDKKIIEEEILEEIELKLIPEHYFSETKNSKFFFRTIKTNKLQKVLFKKLVELAFTKRKLKYSKGINKEIFANEVEMHRLTLNKLLNNNEML